MRLLLVGRIFKGNKIVAFRLYNLDTRTFIDINKNDVKGINILNCSYTNNELKLSRFSNLHLSNFSRLNINTGKNTVGYNLQTIINDYSNCKEKEIENQHNKGKSKDLVEDLSFLNSRDFKDKVYNLAEYILVELDGQNINISKIKNLSNLLYGIFKKILKHRNGTKFEDMYWLINTKKGDYSEFLSKLNSHVESEVRYPEYSDIIKRNKNKLLTIHNHPSSLPPSYKDFKSNFMNNYRYGIVIGNNGNIFLYKCIDFIEEDDYNHEYRRLKYSYKTEYDKQYNTLISLSDSFFLRRF